MGSTAQAGEPMAAIEEWQASDHALDIAQIIARDQPLVIRGLVADWPVVAKARESDSAFARYLAAMDSGALVNALLVPAAADGMVGYNADLSGFNYERHRVTLTMGLGRLARYSHEHSRAGLAIQSAPVAECLPTFRAAHPLGLLDPAIEPRIWIGNHVTTPAHFDSMYNIACVVCGARRFTLFAPEQIDHLYIGPPDFAPTGAPITMARLDQPDDPRFPRLKEALATAQVAELAPGDAIYIPPLWWHNVESLHQLNALVNYWWPPLAEAGYVAGDEMAALYHCVLAFRSLPAAQRQAWQDLLDYYVFDGDEVLQNMPDSRHGVLARPPTREQMQQLRRLARGGLDSDPA